MDKDERLSESEKQEKKLRAANAARKRRKRIKGLIGWLVVILIVSLVLVWFLKMKKESEAKIEELQSRSKKIEYRIQTSTYDQEIDISGYVEPYETLNARFRSTGAVTGVFVKEGDKVTAGQLLATIDDTSQRLSLQKIENQIAEAKLNGSVKSLEELEMSKKNSENNLEYTRLTANFDGVVSEVNVVLNDYFDAGSAAVQIIDRSKLKATVEIDEIDMQYIEIGQTADLTFDSLPGVTLVGYVSYIPMVGRYTSQGIGVVDVEITIDNPPDQLIPGFTFSGVISIKGDTQMLLVPSAAVTTSRGGQSTVQVKTANDDTETRKVNVKYLGEGYCQVISGLSEGEVVIYENSTSSGLMGMMMSGSMGGGMPSGGFR